MGADRRFPGLNLQTRYELEAERERLGARLEREVSVLERSSRKGGRSDPAALRSRSDRGCLAARLTEPAG